MEKIKISADTLSVLKSFARLQSSIVIDAGNEITAISSKNTLLTTCVVEENFPRQFGIYDLNRFLSALSLAKNPTLRFEEDKEYVLIKGDDGHAIKYMLGDVTAITVPPKKRIDIPEQDVNIKVIITKQQIEKIKKSASILSLPDIVISSDGDGEIYLEAMNVANTLSDESKILLKHSAGSDAKFRMVFSAENIDNILLSDYEVEIAGEKKISQFTATSGHDVQYWIAADINSEYERVGEAA